MKSSPSIAIRHMYIKAMFIYKCLAKFQMSIICCEMETVHSSICFQINISSVLNKIFNHAITATFYGIMNSCPSIAIRHIYINSMLIYKCFAKFQMSIICRKIETVHSSNCFEVNISSIIDKIFN